MSSSEFPQQQQQQQDLPVQSVSSSVIENSLLSALATHVPTSSTTEQEIQGLASPVLEPKRVWKNHAPVHGTFKLTKTELAVYLVVDSLGLTFDANGMPVSRPNDATLTSPISGTFYYDHLDYFRGDAVFDLHVKDPELYISIYRKQVYVGRIEFGNITFPFPHGGTRLICWIS
ncbi:hypothetical protein F52700_1905 [Fusarium sp. NRRL 52700]|nr:hypothetical protein F52700_1905 [Fusarium sp. NRRL 52700]